MSLLLAFCLAAFPLQAQGLGEGQELVAELPLLAHPRQLTLVGRRSGEGYFSHDGSLMVFQGERESDNPFYQIYLMSLQTGDIQRVSPGYGKTTCAWIHPQGQQVLFSSTHADPQALAKQAEELKQRASGQQKRYTWDYDEHYEIYATDLRGHNLRNLTNQRGYDAEASWSPDGQWIAFASNRQGYSGQLSPQEKEAFAKDPAYLMDIYIMRTDGTQVRRLTDRAGYDGGPFFSPDGKKIVWRRFAPDGATAEIFTMNTDGSQPKQLTRLGAMSWAPYFHPSGDYLIFATNRHGFDNFELYIVDSQGQHEPIRVTDAPGFDGLPVFSPNGRQLSWTSNRTLHKQSQIFLADWNDSAARQALGLAHLAPAYSPEATLDQTHPGLAIGLQHHILTLASTDMAGRLTGSAGEKRATAYAAGVFQSLGLEPAGDQGTYFQEFEFTAGVSLGKANSLVSTGSHALNQDWRPLAFSKTGPVAPASIAFAGYGIVAPEGPQIPAYDAYVHLDVKDKWVLVLRYLPENIPPQQRQHLARYAGLRYKAMLARDRGARGLIVVSGPLAKVKEELVPLSFDASLTGTSLAAVSVSNRLAQQWFAEAGQDLKALQAKLDTGQAVMGMQLSQPLQAQIDIQQQKQKGHNVLARLKATQPAPQAAGIVVVGAHIDHLGHGETNTSLAREGEKGQIHFGADDNASGVAAVLEMARLLAAQPDRVRDTVFALWSGEELGLLGSTHFARYFLPQESPNLHPQIAAYFNLDMVGRLKDALVLQGLGSSTWWLPEIEKHNIPLGLPLALQDDSYLPTDATAFYVKGVPVLNAFTGAHEEYHTPRDTPDKINWDGAEQVTRLMAALVHSLLSRPAVPDYLQMKKPEGSGERAGLRAYLGTIPDYTPAGITGLKLSGVVKGGPAEQAGLQGGDVIVELAGRKIENIYDYTYALEALKIGQPVPIIVQRGEQRLTLTVTPGSRD